MKSNILITSVGRRVELVQAFQYDLKRFFPDAKVYSTDMKPILSAACRVADGYWDVPRVTDENYVNVLLDLCLKNNIGMVIPTIDTELMALAKNRKVFGDEGVHVIISSEKLIASCRDKRKTGAFFETIGVRSPEIFDKTKLTFPCFVKPYDGSSSKGVMTLHSEDQLTSQILNDKKMMFMELIDDSHIEYTVDAYYSKEGVLRCLVPRERIEVRAGEVSKGVTRKNKVYDYLLPFLKKITGARGCLTIQLFANLDQDSFYGLEINPRFGGGFPITYSAGAHYPSWLISEYLNGNDVGFYDQWEIDLLMLRYDNKKLVSGYV
jgi:carbamoyl-phosphate synthase large subunit